MLEKAEAERVIGEPCFIEAVQVIVSDVPEAVGEPGREGLREERLLPVGFDEPEKVVPKGRFVLGGGELCGRELVSGKQRLWHCELQNKRPAFAGHGAGGWTGMASVG